MSDDRYLTFALGKGRLAKKTLQLFEQIGRYGCIAFMVFNIPFTYFGFWFDKAMLVYAIVNSVLCAI